jgi:hypothetical protein
MVSTEPQRRARRFPIATSLVFRGQGESEWRTGSTVNFSHSGVLFRADEPLPRLGSTVDFIVTLPINGVMPFPQVRCIGHVTRVTEHDSGSSRYLVAVEIDGYAFERRHRE